EIYTLTLPAALPIYRQARRWELLSAEMVRRAHEALGAIPRPLRLRSIGTDHDRHRQPPPSAAARKEPLGARPAAHDLFRHAGLDPDLCPFGRPLPLRISTRSPGHGSCGGPG